MSNYLDRAEEIWQLVQSMPAGGRAVFTVPRPPVSCTGTTVKPLFLAAAHWKRTSRLPGVAISLVIDRPRLLGVPALDAQLLGLLRDLGVRVLHDTEVTELHPDERRITVTALGGTTDQLPYDMLHLVPPFRGPRWLQASNLTGAVASSLPSFLDPLKPRRTAWAVDRYALPRVYWNLILNGRIVTRPASPTCRK